MKEFNLQPTLENDLLIVRPLRESDFENLFLVAADPGIWEQHPSKERSDREGFARFFEEAMRAKSAFVIVDKATNEIIGSSRYIINEQSEKAIEIGYTFLAKKYWGKGYNPSFKSLMMKHAFEHYEYVLYHVHETNFRSQKAVENIGGKRIYSLEGVTLNVKPLAQVIFCISKNEFERSH
jgi:RimJ/RimL family protein N-acetyltransferase